MRKFSVSLGLLALALGLTVSAYAKSKSAGITLYQDATLNGTNGPAGDYTIKYDVDSSNAQVRLMKGSHEVATANGQVKSLSKKPDSNQVILDTAGNARAISEIDFRGQDTGISFATASSAAGK